MTNTHIIRTDRAYGAVNDWPEMRGDEVKLLSAILQDRPSMPDAACVGEDPDLWFAFEGTEERARAQRICAACPMRALCTEAAKASNEPHGVWGGHNFDATAEPDSSGTCKSGHDLGVWGQVIRPRNANPYLRCMACLPPPRPVAPKTHCIRGHEFTPENTVIVRDGKARACRVCKRDRQRASRALAKQLESTIGALEVSA